MTYIIVTMSLKPSKVKIVYNDSNESEESEKETIKNKFDKKLPLHLLIYLKLY